MSKGHVRWLGPTAFSWSSWYDLGSSMPEYLKSTDIIAVQIEEEMTKDEYEKMIKDYNEQSPSQ